MPPPPFHSGIARCRIICGVRDHPWPSHPPSHPQRWIRVLVIWLSGDTCQPWDVWREESVWIWNSWLIQAIWLQGLLLHFRTKPQSHRKADGVLVWPQTHRGGPVRGPVGFLDITSLTLPPQCMPSLGFLSHCSMGKTHIFITAGAIGAAQPFSPLFLSSSSACQSSQGCQTGYVSELSPCLSSNPDTLERQR